MGIADFLKGNVDAVKDLAVRVAINHLLGDIGNVGELRIDRTGRRIGCKLELQGEPLPIDILVDQWEYGSAERPNRVRILGMATSRPWLDAVARRALINRWFDVPAGHMGKIRMALD